MKNTNKINPTANTGSATQAQRLLARITEVIKVDPQNFTVHTRWTTGEIRVIHFAPLFKEWKAAGNTLLELAEQPSVFSSVQLHEGGTLYWPLIARKGYKGKVYPVALDPDVLYECSVSEEENPIIIDPSREFTQKEYARRKSVSESVVRNWVKRGKVKTHYIRHLGVTLVVE